MKVPISVPSLILVFTLIVGFGLANQHRSMPSRVKSDQRSIAVAIESYRVDYPAYPPQDQKNEMPLDFIQMYISYESVWTDPYKTESTFKKIERWNRNPANDSYFNLLIIVIVLIVVSGFVLSKAKKNDMYLVAGTLISLAVLICSHLCLRQYVNKDKWSGDYDGYYYYPLPEEDTWIVQGVGPDLDLDLLNIDRFELKNSNLSEQKREELLKNEILLKSYDPSNGAFSSGDVIRVGGEWSD